VLDLNRGQRNPRGADNADRDVAGEIRPGVVVETDVGERRDPAAPVDLALKTVRVRLGCALAAYVVEEPVMAGGVVVLGTPVTLGFGIPQTIAEVVVHPVISATELKAILVLGAVHGAERSENRVVVNIDAAGSLNRVGTIAQILLLVVHLHGVVVNRRALPPKNSGL